MCDGHYREMLPYPSTLFREDVFRMRLRELRPLLRRMPLRLFHTITGESPDSEKIDPAQRRMKSPLYQATCPLVYGNHSPQKQRPRDQSPLLWHCYACSKIR